MVKIGLFLYSRLTTHQFRKHIRRQAGIADLFRQFLDGGKANVGHLLFGYAEIGGDITVGPALDQKKLDDLEADIVAALAPLADHLAEATAHGLTFQLLAFLAAGQAGGGGVLVELILQDIARALRGGVQGMPAYAPQMIGELVRGDGEQVGLQLPRFVEIGSCKPTCSP